MFTHLVRMGWVLAIVASEFLASVREFLAALWDELRDCPLASPRRARPCLEGLGERIVPTVWVWDPEDGGAGTTELTTALNWKRESDGLRPGQPVFSPPYYYTVTYPNWAGDDFVFDGVASNTNCTYNGGALTLGSVTIGNYSGTIECTISATGLTAGRTHLNMRSSKWL